MLPGMLLAASLHLINGALPTPEVLNELSMPPADCVFTVGANSYDLSALPAFSTSKDSRCTAVPADPANCYDYQMSVCHPVSTTTCPAYNQKGMMLQFKAGRCMSYIGSAASPVATLLPLTLDPSESASPTPLAPTATQPAEAGFQVAFKMGLGPCKGSPDARTVRYQFQCDAAAGVGTPDVVYESVAKTRCDYTVAWKTAYACPGGGPGGGGLFGGHGTMLTILFFVGAAAYVGGGMYYRVKKGGIPLGIEAVPNIDFWRELPALVKDGMQFTVTKAKWLAQMVTSKYEEVK